jgi:hypothetical protein
MEAAGMKRSTVKPQAMPKGQQAPGGSTKDSSWQGVSRSRDRHVTCRPVFESGIPTMPRMSTQSPLKKQPARRKVPVWVPVALAAITTVGGVAVAIAKASEAPSFSFNLSFQIMATNVAKN